MKQHVYQSPVGHMTHPDDVAPGCLYAELIDGRWINCYGSVGLDRDGNPHVISKSVARRLAVMNDENYDD